MAGKEISLSDVWRTCNKIRACLFHTGLKMWKYFLPKDPSRIGLVSVQQFHSVMKADLGEQLNLSDYEVDQLALFFSTADGRILYQQFCAVLHGEDAGRLGEFPYVTGLEFEDPMHTNALTAREERRVHIILVKIAATINARRLVLRPFFQDYELIAKNVGCVTIAHFSRLLNFLGITVASEEFGLLLKKFLKDSYTVNYVAFITAIDNIITQLDRQSVLDTAGDVVPQFAGRVLSAELPKLPRPELARVCYPNYVHHPSLTTPRPDDDLERVIRRIQAYVSEEGVRVSGNFSDMDDLRTGRVSKDQFRRGLDYIGIGGFHRLFLTDNEIDTLTDAYRDPNDESRICWEAFVDDIDRVFTTHGLEKFPTLEVRSPLPPRTCPPMPDRCTAVVKCVARYLRLRQRALRPGFAAFDDLRQGRVTAEQLAKALDTVSLKLSDEDFSAILEYFTDTRGFDYYHFLNMVEPADAVSLYQPYEEKLEMVNREPPPKKPKPQETNIVEILAKIKRKVVRDRVRVIEFLRKFDKNNKDCISHEDFHRGIDQLQIGLSPPEVATLIDVFASPLNPGMVDYRRMAEVAEEAMSQQGLERAPLIVPVQTVAIEDGDHNFLNFEERQKVTDILIRLAHKVDCDLQQKFKDWDAPNIGSISREQFIKVLCIVGLASLFSGQEIDTLVKCFGVERGLRLELDYRALCNSINTLQTIYKRQVF